MGMEGQLVTLGRVGGRLETGVWKLGEDGQQAAKDGVTSCSAV